ncbi:hypothetical protein D9M71_472680 [compost metagenome]
MLVLHQRDGLQAAGDGDIQLVADDALGGNGDAHQARRALPLHRHAGDAGRQPAGDGAQAAEVVRLGTLLGSGADDHILHLARLDTGAAHRFGHHMAAHDGRLGVVEGATEGLADGGAGGGDDDGFSHDGFLGLVLVWARRPSPLPSPGGRGGRSVSAGNAVPVSNCEQSPLPPGEG